MKKLLVIALCLASFANFAFAQDELVSHYQTLDEAYIKYEQLGWQTYEFYVLTNFEEGEALSYEWTIDNKETFIAPKLRFFFDQGDHVIKVKVEDKFGNVQYDTVRLGVRFWSLKNNWFWWGLYLVVILIILYYWVAKIVYLLNRKKVSKEVRYFLDVLDEHGWVERVIAEHVKKKEQEKTPKKGN
jgi:hypothetical protein